MSGDDPILRVRDLRLEAEGIHTTILEGLSFEVGRSEILAVVGESGSGKTMAARSVLRLLPPGIMHVSGSILFEGKDLATLNPAQLRRVRGGSIGMVFQEPMLSLNPAHTVGRQMAEGMRLHTTLTRDDIRRRSIEMLERVRIGEPEKCLDAYPHEFSGGMRQRIILAAVMMLRPKLLIADEPTTALDNLAQREVLDIMIELTREHGTSVMLITHNLGLVSRYANRALVLERGRLVEEGSADQILRSPKDPYTKKLVDAMPARPDTPPFTTAAAPVVKVANASITYAGRMRLFRKTEPKQVVHDVSLEVRPGETVAVVGGSGSGKTTLGRAILGLIPLSAGHVEYRGKPLASLKRQSARAFRHDCQLVFQDPFSSLNPRMRVREIVGDGLRSDTALSSSERQARVEKVLDEVRLSGLGERWPHQLSGGQRQRVSIARALVKRPKFVVADEPVSALDMTVQKQVLSLFRDLQTEHGFACMFISHDLAAVEQVADRVIVLKDGRIIEAGSRDDIFDRPRHPYTIELLEAAPTIRN
jgi:peptide/nickel transport system ATP-binding protein